MFWSDIRATQQVSLNCSLVRQMIQDCTMDDDEYDNDPADQLVRNMTLAMEDFIETKLNHYNEAVSLCEAFEYAWERRMGTAA